MDRNRQSVESVLGDEPSAASCAIEDLPFLRIKQPNVGDAHREEFLDALFGTRPAIIGGEYFEAKKRRTRGEPAPPDVLGILRIGRESASVSARRGYAIRSTP